ncbi:MAG: endopeptidase La [Clostridia bacterium]|nr:endopeptidase La [Clostridia bacterium]
MGQEFFENELKVMPVLPLRGIVLFPGNVFHFDVGRDKSIAAIESCLRKNQQILLIAQKDIAIEEPTPNDLCEIGTVAVVRQVLKKSESGMRVLVEGKYRAKAVEYDKLTPFFSAKTIKCDDYYSVKGVKVDALFRQTKLSFDEYCELVPKTAPNIVYDVKLEQDAGKLADIIASNIPFDYEKLQEVICELDISLRIEKVFMLLVREIELLKMENEINLKVQENIDEHQKEYYLREQIKVISEELGDNTIQEEAEEFSAKIKALELNQDISSKLLKECDTLSKMPSGSHDANVLRNHLDMCINLPWNIESEIHIDLKQARKVLDDDHYGLDKVKDRIIETLAVKKLAPDIKGQILCLLGPPGVGKTSIAKSIAKAIGCKYERIALGGIKDEAEIRGHRRTYVGAMPGRIISAINSAGTKNPLILLDEIDKIGADFRGDPTSALLEVLDGEQNNTFEDHYIDLPFDLSNVFFITTANDQSTIPAPLLDRMDIIELSSYTSEEKFNIAKKHLVGKQMKKHGITNKNFKITDGAIRYIIENYTREAGVRNLERYIAKILRKTAKEIVEGNTDKVSVDIKQLKIFLGAEKFKDDSLEKKDMVGLVNGLAWTSVGGQMLQIEVALLPGNGKLELTGSLGDVMKESAKAALSCVRMRSKKLKLEKDFHKKYDIHIHVPEGAVPKDGPSAGITLATAILSALTNQKVRHDVAMTGEITLRGRVMPIGGLREKSMAAYKNKIKTVLFPAGNKSDLDEVDEKVKENIEFVPVSVFDEVIEYAFVKPKSKLSRSVSIDKDNFRKLNNIPTVTDEVESVYI